MNNEWDDGTVNHAASAEWNSGASPVSEEHMNNETTRRERR